MFGLDGSLYSQKEVAVSSRSRSRTRRLIPRGGVTPQGVTPTLRDADGGPVVPSGPRRGTSGTVAPRVTAGHPATRLRPLPPWVRERPRFSGQTRRPNNP